MFKRRKDIEFAELSNQLAESNESLTIKVAKLTNENHYLRRGNRVKPHVRIVLRARASATLLALWDRSGYRTGRKAAFANGMSDRTWYAARALLMMARVHDGRGFTCSDPAEIEARLDSALARAIDDPDLLNKRMPLSRQAQAKPRH
jgi:hypothetical protein